jgi:hypothetical protein
MHVIFTLLLVGFAELSISKTNQNIYRYAVFCNKKYFVVKCIIIYICNLCLLSVCVYNIILYWCIFNLKRAYTTQCMKNLKRKRNWRTKLFLDQRMVRQNWLLFNRPSYVTYVYNLISWVFFNNRHILSYLVTK